MFNRKPVNQTAFDEAIANALRELAGHEADTEAYQTIVTQLTALNAIQTTNKDRVSKETLAVIACNLAGIIMIVSHEHVNVITSKAFALIGKTR
jgi:FixJ family two-component response regulator